MTSHNMLTRKQFFAVLANSLSDLPQDITIHVSCGPSTRPQMHSIDIAHSPDPDHVLISTDHPSLDLPRRSFTYQDAVDIVRGFLTYLRNHA